MNNRNSLLFALALLVSAFGIWSCGEDPDVSVITNVNQPDIEILAPTMVVTTNEGDGETIVVNFALSEAPVLDIVIGIEFAEGSTADRDDVTVPENVTVPAFSSTGSFDIVVGADILPDEEVDILNLRLGRPAFDVSPFTIENEATVEVRIINDTTGSFDLSILTDWDQGRGIAVPSLGGVFSICGNGVDLDPFAVADAAIYTFSDDYYACPEVFSGLGSYPDNTYIFLTALFDNVFSGFPDAIGDLCVNSKIVRPGISFLEVDQPLSECFEACCDAQSALYGGASPDGGLFVLDKSAGVYTVLDFLTAEVLGVVTRQEIDQASELVHEAIELKKEQGVIYSGELQPY